MLGSSPFSIKAFNFRTVLETIRMQGPISRAEVARITDLTAQSISNITKRLLEHELIKETTKVQEGRGAPSMSLVVNPQGAYSIGLDIDQDQLTGILMDFSGHVLQRKSYPLSDPKPDETIQLMLETIETLCKQEQLDKDRIWGVGIGVPGPLEPARGSIATNVAHPIAFRGWDEVPIVNIINKATSLPVYLENNATAAAVGERWFGYGRKFENYFYLFLGLGLGGGLILNRLPYRGFSGNAGEIGFLPKSLYPSNKETVNTNYVGLHFDIPKLVERLQKKHRVQHVNDLAQLYEAREPQLMEWIQEGARILTPLFLSVEYLIDPDAILVGGRLPTPIIHALVQQSERELPAMRIQEKDSFPVLLTSKVTEDAAALGVATIPLYEVLTPLASTMFASHNSTATSQPYTNANHPVRQIF